MKSKLLDQVRDVIRKKHLSIRTEQAYVQRIVRYIGFSGTIHPKNLSENHISRFFSYLVTDLKVSSSTQNQALNAIIFLYSQLLRIDLERLRQV